MIRVLFFAALKDVVGVAQIEMATEARTVAALQSELAARFPGLAKWLPHVRFAVNQEYVGGEAKIAEGDEVALLPPVSGGGAPFCRVGEAPLSLDEVVEAVRAAMGERTGAICTFLGVVRAHSTDPDGNRHDDIRELRYEAYEAMATREIEKLLLEASQKWDVSVALTHRTGTLQVAEASVAIAVASPHRAGAFEACRFLIEELKTRVPIWKEERAASGAWWVESRDAGQGNGETRPAPRAPTKDGA